MNLSTPEIYAITYHKLSDSVNFEKQLNYLRRRFTLIDYSDVDEFFNGKQLPKQPLILTFDDGDISNYRIAFPLLKKYKIPAIFFVVTDLINTDKPFWWDEIEYYLDEDVAYRKIWEIKNWPNSERLKYLKNLREKTSRPRLKYPQLTTPQLKEMQDEGIIIGNHSHTHPMFDKCSPEELNQELSKSFTSLQNLGFSPEVFAYPNGNFSEDAEEMLLKHGIKYSFLFDHKINKGKIDPLRISRLIVNDTTPLWKFKLILSGWHGKILPLTRALGKLRK